MSENPRAHEGPGGAAPWEARFLERHGRRPPTEAKRICSVPVFSPPTPEEVNQLNFDSVQAVAYDGCDCPTCHGRPFRLLPDQAMALHTYLQTGRGFFSIKVGGGKTGLCMMLASHAHQARPRGKTLLLIPSSVYKQFWLRDLPWGRRHLALSVPWYGLGNASARKRRVLAGTGRPGCYVLPYSCLSTKDTIEILRLIDADLIIADEAHLLLGESAKSKRFWAFVSEKKARGIAMSGTLTKRSPIDYYKLIKWTLGANSPLPRNRVDATRWSAMLKSGAEHPNNYPFEVRQSIRPLVKWAQRRFPEDKVTWSTEGIRKAYRLRMHSTPGFLSSTDKDLGVALEIANLDPGQPSAEIESMISDVENMWTDPAGEVLQYGIEIHNCLSELSTGFYHRRFWDESHPRVNEAKARHAAGQEYSRGLREFFKSTVKPREGMDTPFLVGHHHSQHGAISGWGHLYELWKDWKDLDEPGLPERQSEPIRVDDYKIKAAVAWAKKIKVGGILWVHHKAVGEWLAEELVKAGLPTLRKQGGDTWLNGDGSEDYFCVASIEAHSTGKNLQHHRHQLLVQWPRSSSKCEQLIGRTHRTGQKASRLVVHTNHSTEFDHEQMAATIADTVYDAETMGGQRKLLIADWNPLPRSFPPEFLRARGFAVRS